MGGAGCLLGQERVGLPLCLSVEMAVRFFCMSWGEALSKDWADVGQLF